MTQDELARFTKKFCVDPVTGCWNWTAGKYTEGYGMFFCEGRSRRAHRLSFEHFNGCKLGEWDCCHKCDNPSCVNPDHLFKGNASDNMQDCARKGRHGALLHPEAWRRCRDGYCKLSEDKVRDMKVRLLLGETLSSLSKRFGVGKQMVSGIKNGRHWKYVTIDEALAAAKEAL